MHYFVFLHTYLSKLSCENLIGHVAVNQYNGLSWRLFILVGKYSTFVIPAGPFTHLDSPCSQLSFPETTWESGLPSCLVFVDSSKWKRKTKSWGKSLQHFLKTAWGKRRPLLWVKSRVVVVNLQVLLVGFMINYAVGKERPGWLYICQHPYGCGKAVFLKRSAWPVKMCLELPMANSC